MKHPSRKISLQRSGPQLITSLVSTAAVVLAGMAGIAAAQKPQTSSQVKHGEAVFKAQCVGCHNKEAGDTTPFGPPNLHGILAKGGAITPQQAVETIKQGKGVMPPFADKLNGSDINAVIAYLKTL